MRTLSTWGNVAVEIVGLDNVIAQLAGLGERTLLAAGEAIQAEAEYELSLTQEQVPVDTGQLKASGRTEPDDEGTTIANVIAYGGPPGSGGPEQTEFVDYALIVHEDLEVFHRIGKAKYVEDPVRAEMMSGRAVVRMSADIARMVTSPLGAAAGRTRLTKVGKYSRRGGSWLKGSGGKFLGSTQG
jgi:hypothetical protein